MFRRSLGQRPLMRRIPCPPCRGFGTLLNGRICQRCRGFGFIVVDESPAEG